MKYGPAYKLSVCDENNTYVCRYYCLVQFARKYRYLWCRFSKIMFKKVSFHGQKTVFAVWVTVTAILPVFVCHKHDKTQVQKINVCLSFCLFQVKHDTNYLLSRTRLSGVMRRGLAIDGCGADGRGAAASGRLPSGNRAHSGARRG